MEISGSLKTGECDDWCFGICRYWIFDSVRNVSVFIEAGSEADDRMRELFEERKDR